LSEERKTKRLIEEQSSDSRIFNFNWYPGHIAKAEKQLREKISLIDMIIELVDARIPQSSSHTDLYEWAGPKPVIRVLSKSDVSDPNKNPQGIRVNSKERKNLGAVIREIELAAEPINERFKKKGLINRPFKVMIVGYPNVGKSSLINAIAKKKKAKVENKPGVTRQQQWINIESTINIKLLDTPGIIPTKFNNDDQALKLALCSCVSDRAFDPIEVARLGIELINQLYPNLLDNYYKIPGFSVRTFAESSHNGEDIKAAEHFINDFRNQRFGKISLE
jgi:ribosome biogenesis GTPase A